jgi:hypothetical protein
MEWILISRKDGQGLEGGELTASGLPMTEATVLEASARMAEVSTPSRSTFVDTFRHGILAHLQLVFSASESGLVGLGCCCYCFLGSKQQTGAWVMASWGRFSSGPLAFLPKHNLGMTMTLLDAQTITYIYDTDH